MQNAEEETFEQLLEATSGVWRGCDGLRERTSPLLDQTR
jgi:hypothetical protein